MLSSVRGEIERLHAVIFSSQGWESISPLVVALAPYVVAFTLDAFQTYEALQR
jgi:hypothetical protein